MVKVTIRQNGTPNDQGKEWSYKVESIGCRFQEEYEVRARGRDNHYLLETRMSEESNPNPHQFTDFGINDLEDYEKADGRMYEKARMRAKSLLDDLTPSFHNNTERGKEKISQQ